MPESSISIPETNIGAREKVQILLAEYNTLRSEMLTRTSNGFQVTAIGAGLFALLLQKQQMDIRFWIGVLVFVLGALLCAWIVIGAIGRAAKRVLAIEKKVNEIAGESLLIWETIHGEARGKERVGIYAYFVRAIEKWEGWISPYLRRGPREP